MLRIISLLILLILNIASNVVQAQERPSEMRIGAIMPLTGPTAFYGQSIQRGIELAVAEINAAGGVDGHPVKVIFEGFDYLNLKIVATAAKKLITVDKIEALLTTWSEDTEIATPIAAAAQIPVIAMAAGAKDLTKRSPFLFRVWPSDESFIRAEIAYAMKLGMKRPAVVAAQAAYFTSLKDLTVSIWQEQTGIEPSVEEVSPGETDFTSVLTRLRAKNPDLLFLRIPLERMGAVLLQVSRQKMNVLKIGTQESDSSAVLEIAKDAAEGVIFPSYESADPEFQERHKKKFGLPPGVAAEYGYDAVKLLALAAENGKGKSDELRNRLISIKDYKGASGLITFSKDRDRSPKRVILRKIERGKAVEISQ